MSFVKVYAWVLIAINLACIGVLLVSLAEVLRICGLPNPQSSTQLGAWVRYGIFLPGGVELGILPHLLFLNEVEKMVEKGVSSTKEENGISSAL